MRTKMPDDSSQLLRRLCDETARAFLFDKGVDFRDQSFDLRDVESHRGLPLHRPRQWAIERRRSKIRRQK